MKDVLLALCVGLMFVLGYFPMRRLDRFLEKNRGAGGPEPRRAPAGERRARASMPGQWRSVWPLLLRHRS